MTRIADDRPIWHRGRHRMNGALPYSGFLWRLGETIIHRNQLPDPPARVAEVLLRRHGPRLVRHRLDSTAMPESRGTPSPRPAVRGLDLDPATRCVHYRTEVDIVAIRMACCDEYFACKECHEALAGHDLLPWPPNSGKVAAVLCGACSAELTIQEYLTCDDACTRCGAAFNSRCRLHHHFYFAQ